MSDHQMTGSSSPSRCPCGNTSPHLEFLPPIPQLIGPCDVEEWKIKWAMPQLLSAGLRAYDDDYDFDPQELWNYITRYIRFGTRSDSLKDRMLLHLFYCGYLRDDAKFEKHEYILMRRCLRTLGIEVHPMAMREADIDEDDLGHDDREWVYSQGLTEVQGRWLTDWSKTWNASKAFDRDDFAKMLEDAEDQVVT
ncbi:hypothetical protein NEUTE1DRAFT_34486 [Neurospora tetrasperma FGSC 2508]|uniref:Uncharacterized protein n=1 Tax=Neurospora tetrasperma (strain FGSC 2508 / ATCC MYA-4615 / P0657) TaxID=510951 RepID=F8MAT9_NEUT8|nr:uncharacterized protein NEUTE1DRAFT_34486 [Neurospora tetrasperma FGSC 2508]EGO60157.1 hypothetical protein NEUTE1DRAFT_34486 [Neurospora tetrasperma FGSC 2508]EGZ75888.1 hypothetical protein NEUTE2DRAFT_57818 [Neurospora tetrasperma FGSC 2509]